MIFQIPEISTSPAHKTVLVPNMKRKLDQLDRPQSESSDEETNGQTSFAGFDLDPRLLRAVEREGYAEPTPVQAKSIPLALEGKDIIGWFLSCIRCDITYEDFQLELERALERLRPISSQFCIRFSSTLR